MSDAIAFIVIMIFVILMIKVIASDNDDNYDDPNLTNDQKNDIYYHRYF